MTKIYRSILSMAPDLLHSLFSITIHTNQLIGINLIPAADKIQEQKERLAGVPMEDFRG